MTTTDAPAAPAQVAPEAERRSAYTAGLRVLADALDNNPDLPLPYNGTSSELTVFADTKAELVAYTRLLLSGGKVEKKTADGAYGFECHGSMRGLRVAVYAHREQVCERVVTGTREVTREVPDPAALAAVPTTTVTETVEDVEWVCRPLLDDSPVSA